MLRRKPQADDPFPGYPFCAVDRNGKRYTTAVAAVDGDWWFTAEILMPHSAIYLRREGLLPLREVNPITGEVLSTQGAGSCVLWSSVIRANMGDEIRDDAGEMHMWFASLVVGAINDHWWMGSQSWGDEELTFDPTECGPCAALGDMPRHLAEEAVRRYNKHCGVCATYWDTKKDTFRDGVDFTKPADIEALLAAEKAEGHAHRGPFA